MQSQFNCSLPRVSSLCQGCDGTRSVCADLKKTTTTQSPVRRIQPSEPVKNPIILPPALSLLIVNQRTKTPDREMPFEECSRNCLPPNAKVAQYCHNCNIFKSHPPKTEKTPKPTPKTKPLKILKKTPESAPKKTPEKPKERKLRTMLKMVFA